MNERTDRVDGAIGSGSAVEIASAAEAMLPSDPHSAVFIERARTLMQAVTGAVAELRDRGHAAFDRAALYRYTSLPELMGLSRDSRLSEAARAGIHRYLQDLPGFDGMRADQSCMTHTQHGYARVYWQGLVRRELKVA